MSSSLLALQRVDGLAWHFHTTETDVDHCRWVNETDELEGRTNGRISTVRQAPTLRNALEGPIS